MGVSTRLAICLAMLSCATAATARGQEFGALPADGSMPPGGVLDEAIVEWGGGGVEQAVMYQPPPPLDRPATPTPQPTRSRSAPRANVRLASVPNMFGDVFMSTATFQFFDPTGQRPVFGSVDLPGAGGSRRVKIGENTKPIPEDRVYFMYNHFHNVFEITQQQVFPPGPPSIRQEPIDRYTIGLEKTFLDGQWSVELRMPFNGMFDVQEPDFAVSGGNVGNLAVILKRLMYFDGTTAIGAGLGIDVPTGSDAEARVGDVDLDFENEAVHLLPYIGFVTMPGERFFFTGYLQVDVAATGNPVLAGGGFGNRPPTELGLFNDQNLLYADLAIGYYLYRNPDAERWTGVAAVTEFHYTTSLQDSDVVGGFIDGAAFALNNPLNRFDVINATIGIQVEMFNLTSLRVGGVFPLSEDERFFDSEVQVQLNRKF